ncbi:MAG: hypothetical protein FD123_3430 [Bacteroidetes bacterium]|nr:MAG: hypothetical protein FD123_3430 [Bacteroidota bacterium]
MKKNCFLFSLLFLPAMLHAQFSGIVVGYHASYCNPGEINYIIRQYNNVNGSALEKEMPLLNWSSGLVLGFALGDEERAVEIRTIRRSRTIYSEFDNQNASGQTVLFRRQIKMQSNFLSIGYTKFLGKAHFGASLDLGNFKAAGKRAPESEIKDTDAAYLWGEDFGKLQMATTIYGGISFIDGLICVRPYIQLQFFKKRLATFEEWILAVNNSREQRLNNAGVELTFKLFSFSR